MRLAVTGAQRKAARVHPWEPGRMRARPGRVGMAAKVVRLRLARLHRGGDHVALASGHQACGDPGQEPTPGGVRRRSVR